VSSRTAPLLLELCDGGYRNPAALAAALEVDKAYVTRALQSLAEAGQSAAGQVEQAVLEMNCGE
jgi:DNA-binding MarR family transcriptional regulator